MVVPLSCVGFLLFVLLQSHKFHSLSSHSMLQIRERKRKKNETISVSVGSSEWQMNLCLVFLLSLISPRSSNPALSMYCHHRFSVSRTSFTASSITENILGKVGDSSLIVPSNLIIRKVEAINVDSGQFIFVQRMSTGIGPRARRLRRITRSSNTQFTVYSIHVTATQGEDSDGSPLFAQTWEIRKRYSQFSSLHTTLCRSIDENVPVLPSKTLWRHFDDSFISYRAEQLFAFLDECCKTPAIRDNPAFRAFLEYSAISFCPLYGPKSKEGYLDKLSGGRHSLLLRPGELWRSRTKRWFVVRDSFVAYFANNMDIIPRGIMLFDSSFKVSLLSLFSLFAFSKRKITY